MIISCGKADTSAIEARLDSIEKASIASLQSQISQINTTLGTLQATQTQLSGFVTTLQTSVGTLEGNYASLNTAVDNLGKQDSKFEKDIADLAKAVDDCGKDVKKWVEESYTTLTKFGELQVEVSTIKTNIQTIFSRLDGLDSETKRISDGSVKLSKAADNKVRFEIYPLQAAKSIADAGPSILSLDYVETLTKSSEEFVNLPVTDVAFTGKTVLVTVDGTGLPDTIIEGTKTAGARLKISDGTITRSSEFFPIYRQESGSGSQQSGIAITGDALDIGETSATLYGWSNQKGSAGASVVFGIEYSSTDLTTAAITVKASEKDAENKYSCLLTCLMYNTLYYYRAFTLYNGVRIYGEIKTLITEPHPIPQAVDMGTVVNGKNIKWASFNIGASSPEEYGFYIAWGETERKLEYPWDNYKFNTRGDILENVRFSKYNTKDSYGPIDNKTVLEQEDDVAHLKLSGNWRIPTWEEWEELWTKCTCTWTLDYNGTGVSGTSVTATNGNSIFLPAAGYRSGTRLYNAGSSGNYWSSSVYTDSPFARGICFNFSELYMDHGERYSGFSIRPVWEE